MHGSEREVGVAMPLSTLTVKSYGWREARLRVTFFCYPNLVVAKCLFETQVRL